MQRVGALMVVFLAISELRAMPTSMDRGQASRVSVGIVSGSISLQLQQWHIARMLEVVL